MNRYFYDPGTEAWGAADDLEIINFDDSGLDADEVEQELAAASQSGAGLGLGYTLDSVQALTTAAINALADLEGIMPDHEPSGDREHPGWQTIEELKKALGRT